MLICRFVSHFKFQLSLAMQHTKWLTTTAPSDCTTTHLLPLLLFKNCQSSLLLLPVCTLLERGNFHSTGSVLQSVGKYCQRTDKTVCDWTHHWLVESSLVGSFVRSHNWLELFFFRRHLPSWFTMKWNKTGFCCFCLYCLMKWRIEPVNAVKLASLPVGGELIQCRG